MEILRKYMRVGMRPGYYAEHYFQKWKNDYSEYRRTAYFRKIKDKIQGAKRICYWQWAQA